MTADHGSAGVADLVHGRLLMVGGKGGTGKSCVAAAFGRLAAAQGRRTIVVEVNAHHSAMDSIFGRRPGFQPVEVEPRLWIANITWQPALREWIGRVVPMARIVRLLLDNRLVQLFLNATPGNREVVMLSKLGWLVEDFDLVVVDLPSSGHAVMLLEVPFRLLKLFRAGPLRRRGDDTMRLLADPGTALVLVTLPEELVVNETVETWRRLRTGVPVLRIPMVVLNQASRPTLTDPERELLGRLSGSVDGGPGADLLVAGRWEAELEADTAAAQDRLGRDLEATVILVPRLPRDEGGGQVVRRITAALARSDAGSRTGSARST